MRPTNQNQEEKPVRILRKWNVNETFLRFLDFLHDGMEFGFNREGISFVRKDNELTRFQADVLQKIVPLTPAQITGMFANAVELVPAPGPGKAILYLDSLLVYRYGVATYTGGGNVQVRLGTTVVNTVVSSANSFGATANRIATMRPPVTTALLTENVNLNINNLTGAFVNPGTATGYGMIHVYYKIIDVTKPVEYSL